MTRQPITRDQAYQLALHCWRATSIAIVSNPDRHTASQRRLAWIFLREHGASDQ